MLATSSRVELGMTAGAAIGCAMLAVLMAPLGVKGVVAALVGTGFLALLVLAKDRFGLLLTTMVLSLVLLMHKSLGSFADNVHSGAPGLYLSTLDVALAMLYLHWYLGGRFAREVVAAIRRPIFWLPLVALLLSLVSVVAATDVGLAFAQAVRFLSMYALYFFIGTRVRTRREVTIVLAALGVLGAVQFVVVVLQWRTGGVLGLSFLGVPTELGERTLDTGQLGRPFGTIIHPVFLGAVVGMLALVALSLAIHLRHRLARLVSLAMVGVCLVPIVLAHTRAAAVAFAVAALLLGGVSLAAGRLTRRAAARTAVAGLVALVLFYPQASAQFSDNFKTEHFRYELDSRNELNAVAVEMFYDHPLLGVGLNNFEQALPKYSRYGLIFDGNPVHNLFLLQLSECGLIGLASLLGLGLALAVVAQRLARSRDPLFGGIGAGALAVIVFLVLEEQLGFSLRQEVPLALFWIVSGLVVACSGMESEGGRAGPDLDQRRPRLHHAARRSGSRVSALSDLVRA